MEHDDDVAIDPTRDETLVDLQNQDEESWLHLILGFPYIGEILAAIVAMLPTLVLGIAVLLILDTDSDIVLNWVILLTLPVTYFWLRYLERKAGLALCLPLPIVNIRIKWTLLPIGLILAYHLFTGQTW